MDKGSVVALLSETPEDDWYHVAIGGEDIVLIADDVIGADIALVPGAGHMRCV